MKPAPTALHDLHGRRARPKRKTVRFTMLKLFEEKFVILNGWPSGILIGKGGVISGWQRCFVVEVGQNQIYHTFICFWFTDEDMRQNGQHWYKIWNCWK